MFAYVILSLCLCLTLLRCMTACVGNLFYLAPEVYTGEHYSESADIYSFGILMWEVVARESPHGGINPQVVGGIVVVI